jgi:hypothetical protein
MGKSAKISLRKPKQQLQSGKLNRRATVAGLLRGSLLSISGVIEHLAETVWV